MKLRLLPRMADDGHAVAMDSMIEKRHEALMALCRKYGVHRLDLFGSLHVRMGRRNAAHGGQHILAFHRLQHAVAI